MRDAESLEMFKLSGRDNPHISKITTTRVTRPLE
jgi:hypothetical protein